MKRSVVLLSAAACLFTVFVLGVVPSAPAGDLPQVVSITSHKMGSLGYTLTGAFREAVEKYSPMKLRVEPYGQDVAMFKPLRSGESEFTMATGAQATCGSYGMLDFAKDTWGPQPLRVVWLGSFLELGVFVPGDSKVMSLKDVKGLRAPFVPGAAAYNANTAAHLAFGGYTMDDMKKVTCSSYPDALEAVIEKKTDLAFAAPSSPKVREVFAARGGRWLPMPPSDKEAWGRLNEIAPWFVPTVMKNGVGQKEGETVDLAAFPYTICAYDHLDADVAYAFAKSMHQGYEMYKGMHKQLPKWTIQQAVSGATPIPYHEGAIRYFKEAGVWTEEMEKWQAAQLQKFEDRVAKWKKSK
jgi:TRAP transporter TAXI family solute receptor